MRLTPGKPERFGAAPDGSDVELVAIENGGALAQIMTWGASLQDFRIAGVDHPLILGSPEFAPYLGVMRHYGAIVGPVANRISGGEATLMGLTLTFEHNEGGRTHLHGGSTGTSVLNWRLEDCDASSLVLSLNLPDGFGGLPGNRMIGARCEIDSMGALIIEMTAQTDAPTYCNLAHHAYWTLGAPLLDHGMQIEAERYLPVDEHLIPRGPPADVAGTRFDFRQRRKVIDEGDTLLDHNFCLRKSTGIRRICTVQTAHLLLDIESDAPGLQVYDGTGIDSGDAPTLTGTAYQANAGLALEPQGWPDAPNRPEYPSVLLHPEEPFHRVSRFHVAV